MSNPGLKTRTPNALSRVLKYSLPLFLLGYIYFPTFVWMVDRWAAPDSYYGHGFLIPLISLYWIFKKRRTLAEMTESSDPLAWVPLIAALFLQVAASIFRIYFLSAFSFVFLLTGGVSLLFGRKVLRGIAFPLAFLFLMIPLPLLMISQITLKMKFFVAEIATHWVNTLGIRAAREGSYILTPHSVILVGDPCSGLRSFLAFFCLGLVMSYESRLSLNARLFLVAAGLPLALISNIFRVFLMSLVGEIYGMQTTKGFVHDASGIAVFVMAFVVFLYLRKTLEVRHVS